MRKRDSVSPQEMERRQRQRVEAVAGVGHVTGPWGDMHEARRRSGLGRSKICELIAEGKIRSAKIGKRRLIDIPFFLGYIASKATGPAAE